MNKDKIKQYIENIEQLGADSRYYNDLEKYDNLKVELESIIYWSEKALKELKKELKKEN